MKTFEETLSNGLRVFIIHKPGFVKSLFMCGFGVGGLNIREKQNDTIYTNPSGCAHFLEHQMFRLDGTDVSERMSAMSASANAFTSYEETAYYFSTSADPLGPLGLLLDFVQTLDITDASVEKEKGIILSEYNMYDQSPDSCLMTETLKSLYVNHPLNTDILGTPDDIANMSRENLERFYNINYDPSKMFLIGVTGRDPEPILEFIREHEENYPSKNNVVSVPWYEPEPETVARETYEFRRDVAIPYACIGFKFKPVDDVLRNAKRDLVFNIWLDGIFGPLNPEYQKWLDRRILTQVWGAEADLASDHAYALFYAQTEKPREFMDRVKELVKEKRPLDEKTFEVLRRQNVASSIRMRDQFQALACQQLDAAVKGLDFDAMLSLPMNITYEDMVEVLEGIDFSNYTETIINPLNNA